MVADALILHTIDIKYYSILHDLTFDRSHSVLCASPSFVILDRVFVVMAPSVLLLGATGFLGGTILTDLEKGDYIITSIVRPEREACLTGRKTKVLLVSMAAC